MRRQVSPRTGQPADGEIMNLRGVANYLHCHYFTIYRLLAKGAFPAFRLGSDWRFRRSDVDKWIDDRTIVVSETESGPRRRTGAASLQGRFAR